MLKATMTAAWNALKNGLECDVIRAWPQTTAPIPACFFRVQSWDKNPDGSDTLLLAVVMRTSSPVIGDEYTAAAAAALLPLNYALVHAEDSVESETGFFLRELTFSLVQNAPPIIPPPPTPLEEQFPLLLYVWDSAAGTTRVLPSPLQASFIAESKQFTNTDHFANSANNFPAFPVGVRSPGSITFSCNLVQDDPALALLQATYAAGNTLGYYLRYRFSNLYNFQGIITSWHCSPLGVRFTITVTTSFNKT